MTTISKTRLTNPTIYIDLDGMAANLLKKLIGFYNEEHGTNIAPESAWDHHHSTHALVADSLDNYLERDRVFCDLDPMPGFTEALPELQDIGHVIIASSPSRNPDSATDKTRWVLDRFPSIDRKDVILIKRKYLLRGEVWLEDWPTNIAEIRKTNPNSFMGSISYPYNKIVQDALNLRADGLSDTANAWRLLVKGVRDFVNAI